MRTLVSLFLLAASLSAEWHEAPRHDLDFDAAQSYCAALEKPWRVPTIRELFELRGSRAFSPETSFWSSDSAFDGISRTGTGSEGDAGLQQGSRIGYSFFLRDGDITLSPVTKRIGVLCTDTPLHTEKREYERTEEGVIDRQNDLLWSRLDAYDRHMKRSFEGAQEFCERLELHGRSWRLPTLDELYSIVTYERTTPSVDTGVFGVMMSRYYWSDDEFGDDAAYVVGFKLGSVATSDRENRSYFRCVSDLE
jgi:hypothetical protein